MEHQRKIPKFRFDPSIWSYMHQTRGQRPE